MRAKLLLPFALISSLSLSGCSGGFPSLIPDSLFGNASDHSIIVDNFSQTCLANPQSFSGIQQAAEITGWKRADLTTLGENGFGGIKEHIKTLSYATNARAMTFQKKTGDQNSVLFFYKLNLKNKPQIRCELYTHNKNRKKVFNALATRLNSKPFRQRRSEKSHIADWKMNEQGQNVQVRYFYKTSKEKFFDFKGTLLWTYASV